MKHWIEQKVNRGYGNDYGIVLKHGDERIISAQKTDKGIILTEECDFNFGVDLTKKEALELVEELKNWINAI
jgi:hypothetical protein